MPSFKSGALLGATLFATSTLAATYERQEAIVPTRYVFAIEVAQGTHRIKCETGA